MTSPIPYDDFGGSGAPILFAHANGYPPACYLPLLSKIRAQGRVTAIRQRPLWENESPQTLRDWIPLSRDLLRFIEERFETPVIAIGHSVGGVATLRAALLAPEKFRAVILLDPVLFPPRFIRFFQLMRLLKMEERVHPLVAAAKHRRRHFEDLERVFRGYRRKSVFRYFSDDALRAYIKGITCPSKEGGYELCYTPEWETRIYVTGIWRDMDIWRALPKLVPPLLILRGAETDTFWERTAALVQKRLPSAEIRSIPRATHLVPLEQPERCAEEIHAFLSALSKTQNQKIS